MPWRFEIPAGNYLEAWLLHDQNPVGKFEANLGRRCPMSIQYEALPGETEEQAIQRLWPDWTPRKDMHRLIAAGLSRIAALNIFSSEPGNRAPFLASLVLGLYDSERAAMLADVRMRDLFHEHQFRKNQVVALSHEFAAWPTLTAATRLRLWSEDRATEAVQVQLLLTMSRFGLALVEGGGEKTASGMRRLAAVDRDR